MKIILLKDVRKVGQKGHIVEVKEGYGRNFLIKGGYGKLAVKNIIKDFDNKKNILENNSKKRLKKELKKLKDINKKKFDIQVNTNEKGHFFASFGKKDIAEKLKIDEKNILFNEEIKQIGEYEVSILLGGKKGKVFLNLIS